MEKREVEYNEEIYKKFFDLVGSPDEGAGAGTRRVSQSKAAQALGYSSGVVSAYKSRTYNGNVKAFEEAAAAWLKREERRIAKLDVPTAETSALDSVRKAVMRTRRTLPLS